MKIAHKVGLAAATVLFLTTSLLSLLQVTQVRDTLRSQIESSISESSNALARQIENWLNAKLRLMDTMSQTIDSHYGPEETQRVFDLPLLKDEFILVFGALEATGQTLKNSADWNPAADYDGRKRPWYGLGKGADRAVLTEPYVDSTTGEILISAVAKISDAGRFLGVFGGDIRLQSVADAVNTLDFNGAGYAFLLSRSGNIISHPNSDYNGKSYSELFGDQSPALGKELREVEADGKTLLISFTPLPNLRGMDWYIGVVLDESVVMAETNRLTWLAVVGTVVGVAISLVVLGLLMNSLLKPLGLLSSSLREINSGEGDLTRRLAITSNDEVGELSQEFNRFLQTLQTLIGDVMSSSHHVRESTALTSNESEQAARRLQEQLQEVDQLATAMQEMASTAEEVARNAQAAAQAAVAANEETENGVRVVSQSSSAIRHLADEMDGTSHAINELAKLSHNIESILQVITSIAEQTNLLALNAAIEAARAGESGRGFAVVADEVRSLASRTQQATQEIRQMIDQLQGGVRQAENRMQQSRDTASRTAEEASAANDMLGRIREAITRINDMNLQIATAAEEQSATTEEINRNTTNIRDISHELASGAEQQVRQCASMVEQVGQQDRLLGRFKV
ncbi:methyl-accepting chemotaxis protein [Ectopseudomonas mendocina]|uniref:Chemotaxis protein n=1 Tax=Ectopseudomonas mendocina S5.2 TaxID=1225174 RepID=A0ABN4IU15_ECTME|nr:methyl-accepting chemotaxis protein [Pseudomonas mendocina]ALN19233.1 chemotaxis protein [Pseudomonas mendocina S5.2]KER99896.1 chemotaxis protein [Pseudomonas mendocina]